MNYWPLPLNYTNHSKLAAKWEGAFTRPQLDEIVRIGDALPKEEGKVGGDVPNYRKSNISWLNISEETKWIYDALAVVAGSLNKDFYGFDLTGVKTLQYTVYDSAVQGHYKFHRDLHGVSNKPQSKLSLVLQLSAPDEYEGGDLMINETGEAFAAIKERGIIHAFPSFVLHRVTPVTAGVRKTIVAWFVGPDLR